MEFLSILKPPTKRLIELTAGVLVDTCHVKRRQKLGAPPIQGGKEAAQPSCQYGEIRGQ